MTCSQLLLFLCSTKSETKLPVTAHIKNRDVLSTSMSEDVHNVITHNVCMKPLQLQISTQTESDHILLYSFLHTVKHLREFITTTTTTTTPAGSIPAGVIRIFL